MHIIHEEGELMEEGINANVIITYCEDLSDEEYDKVKNWFRLEDKRRVQEFLKEEKDNWLKKLRRMRKGHKLMVKHNLQDIPAGSIVKLVTAKGRKKWVSIAHKGKEWDVPADCLGEPDDLSVRSTARLNSGLAGLFS